MLKYLLLLSLVCFWACGQPAAPAPAPTEKIVWEFTESLNGAKEHSVGTPDGKIEMTAGAETDFFIEPGAPPYDKSNAPLLLRTIDNTKPFTFSFKTTPVHNVMYDAGMAFLYVDNRHWLKFAFEADERMNKRAVTVKTRDFSDDNNHDVINAAAAYLKISSDTKAVGFYYSVDGQQWQLVRVFKNEYPAQLKVGIGTQSPAGKGTKAIFEDLKLTEESVKDFRMGI